MTEVQSHSARAAAAEPHEQPAGLLTATRVDRTVVGLLVLSLFFDRFDRWAYVPGRLQIPDVTFDVAIGILTLRYLYELVRGRARIARPTSRELVAAGFLLLLLVLGVAALLALPHWMTSKTHVAKTFTHVAFLLYAMVLIGRTVSRDLLEFALKLYFWLASAAAALALLEAVDLNAGHGALSRHLDLVFRAYANGYRAPVSIFPEPAHLGYFCLAAIVVGFYRWEVIGRRRALLGSALCAAAVLLALSVGPIFVGAVVLAILLFERRHSLRISKRGWVVLAAGAAIVAGIALATPAGPALSSRVSNIAQGKDGSGQYRAAVMGASIHVWKLAPATGVGLGDTRIYLPSFVHLPFATNTQFDNADGYLSLLGDAGPLGTAGFLLLIATLLWPARLPQSRLSRATQLNVLVVALSLVIDGAFPPSPLFWFWAGMRLADVRTSGESDLFGETIRDVGGLFPVSRRTRRARREASDSAGLSHAAVRRRLLAPGILGLLALVSAVAFGYAIRAQPASSHSVTRVNVGGTTLIVPTHTEHAGLAHLRARQWSSLYCTRKGHCRYTTHYVGGPHWELFASWRSGSACIIFDATAPLRRTDAEPSYLGFAGFEKVACPF